MYIPQKQLENLRKLVVPGKVIVVYGPRRCGKTTLMQQFLKEVSEPYLFVNGEDITIREYLGSQSISKLKEFVGKNTLLVVDEAQKVSEIGLNLKLIVDHIPDVKVVATGSSSFDLAHEIGEPLTGRKYTLRLFPIAQFELREVEQAHETRARLESRLLYGSYPEVILAAGNQERERYLKEIVSSYLTKDILELEGLRHTDKLVQILRLLAFQVGNEVSMSELGQQVGMSKNTMERYLDLLEKAFVIFHLSGFSRNLRKEVTKNKRFYFLDVGIRNAVINNFNPLSMRDDVGMLWENYLIAERIKKREYLGVSQNIYFWRTYDQHEVDFIEEREGKVYAYEMKWGTKKDQKPPSAWISTYPEASFEVIHRENYLTFVS